MSVRYTMVHLIALDKKMNGCIIECRKVESWLDGQFGNDKKEEEMKPVIKIWCLPHNQTEEDYRMLYRAVVDAIVATRVGIPDETCMVVLMPKDLMEKGLGNEIIVEIDSAEASQNRMIDAVLRVIKSFFPKAYRQGKFTFADVNGVLSCLHVTL